MTTRTFWTAIATSLALAGCSAVDNSGYEITQAERTALATCNLAGRDVYEKAIGSDRTMPDLVETTGSVVTDTNQKAIIWNWSVPTSSGEPESITCQTDLNGEIYDFTIGTQSFVTWVDRKFLSPSRTRWSGE